MSVPLISVLVPVYNVEKYLEECIESIIKQKYKNLEIILVDDGSTDSSGATCDRYAEKDSRIKVIHQKNQGLATVRNVSIAAATGKYVGFVDSDDFISPDMYSDMVSIAEENNADIVMCNLGYVDQHGNEIPNYRSAQPIDNNEMTGRQFVTDLCNQYNSTYVVTVDKLYRRNLFEGIRYPDGRINEDEAVIHRIAHKCNKIVFTSKAYYFYRQQPQSIMNKTFSVKRFDSIYADIDRIKLLEENSYNFQTIMNCKMFMYNDFVTTLKAVDITNPSNKPVIKKFHKLVKPYCKELIKWNGTTKKQKRSMRILSFNPFLYVKLYKREK